MKEKLKRQVWGWGFHVDVNGALHDTFPRKADKPLSTRTKRRVKPRLKKALAMGR